MDNPAALQAVAYGRVQGVFFRNFVLRHAVKLGLTGYVRNLPYGKSIEVVAEGEKDSLERLVAYLKVGPPASRVEELTTNWIEYRGCYPNFTIGY